MKKILNIALTALLAVAMTACSDDDPNLGIPVVNPQQPVIPADGVSASDIVTEGGNVDLNAAQTNGFIDMLQITRLDDFPADQQLKVVMNVSGSQDMANARAIDLVIDPAADAQAIYVAKAPAMAWDEAFKAIVSREPTAKTMYVNYVAYAVQGTTTVLLGAVGTPQSVSVTPFSPEHPIESEYYIYGTISDNTIASAVKLNHEGSLYDNPVFSVKVNITAEQIGTEGWKFKVIPVSTKQAGQTWEENHDLTFIGAGKKVGTLDYATPEADCQWVVITTPGEYMLNVNLYDLTYELANAIEYLYMPGAGNGWSWSTKLYTNDYVKYMGFANLTGEFKITGTAGWNTDLGNYGAGADNYIMANGSNTNFQLDGTPGLYWVNVNLPALTYNKTLIESIGVVGSHNGWNAGAPTELEPDSDNLVWTTIVTLSDTDEFKFCMNHGWGINFGGAEDDLEFNSSKNLSSPGAGNYLVVLDLSTIPYSCALVPQE